MVLPRSSDRCFIHDVGDPMTHWFKEACHKDPKTCVFRREDVCENPVSDCLWYEKILDDVRTDRMRDFDEIEEESYGHDD
jgi:hypothetical protein